LKRKAFYLVTCILVVALVFGLSLAGCKSTTTTTTVAAETTTTVAAETTTTTVAAETTTAAAAKTFKFGYISKLLTHPWFTAESAGIEKFCKENGIEYVSADANMDDEKCLQLVDELITQKIDALMICATSQGIGPAIVEKCTKAGIPVLTIDDTLLDSAGKQLNHVGLPTKEVGIMGGEALAKLAKEMGFFDDAKNVVKVMNLTSPKLSVLMERTEGYTEALKKNTPLTKDSDYILVDTKDGMLNNALPACNAVVSANPKVTHWIATGINDDCGIAAVRTCEELGIAATNYISCGLGGYDLALEELAKGNASFITIGLRPDIEGYTAGEEMYKFLKDGTALKEYIEVGGTMVNVDNYKESPFWKG
jgi:ABC-type sugar transport system substrate-binding protein